MYITLACSNRALQNIRFKWLINFLNLGLITNQNRSFRSYSNFSMLTCKLQTKFESYRCRTRLDPKRVLKLQFLNLIIFVIELSLAGQHFSSHYRYYFSLIFLQWNFLTLLHLTMYTRFLFGKKGNNFRKDQEVHELGLFVDPLSPTDGNISELAWICSWCWARLSILCSVRER